MCQVALAPPGQRDVNLLLTLSHQSGFPSKPPLGKWEFNAWPQGLE